jgi:hypothetical protein
MEVRQRTNKPRVRLFHWGKATFRLVTRDRGWGGPYGQERRPAKWACIDCGAQLDGTDEAPYLRQGWSLAGPGTGEPDFACARNGHAPCWACGKQLPRLNDGCPREHRWNRCPAKTEGNRMNPQHAAQGHHRPVVSR